MRKTITVQHSDGVDQVMALTDGRTAAFTPPAVRGGLFLRVFDTPARGTEYAWGADYRIEGAGPPADPDGSLRLAAVPGGRLRQADSVYVVTRGNITEVAATVEVYGEEDGTDG